VALVYTRWADFLKGSYLFGNLLFGVDDVNEDGGNGGFDEH